VKVLFLGSLLVMLGVVAWAAIDWAIDSVVSPAPRPLERVFGFVNVARYGTGDEQSTAIVWQTSTAPEDCAYVVDRRNREEQSRIADLMTYADASLHREDENVCAPFQLGEVEDGAKVEVLGECGRMAKVKILAGRLRGREGCIPTADLVEEGRS